MLRDGGAKPLPGTSTGAGKLPALHTAAALVGTYTQPALSPRHIPIGMAQSSPRLDLAAFAASLGLCSLPKAISRGS